MYGELTEHDQVCNSKIKIKIHSATLGQAGDLFLEGEAYLIFGVRDRMASARWAHVFHG